MMAFAAGERGTDRVLSDLPPTLMSPKGVDCVTLIPSCQKKVFLSFFFPVFFSPLFDFLYSLFVAAVASQQRVSVAARLVDPEQLVDAGHAAVPALLSKRQFW
jgi:hypothetical protein